MENNGKINIAGIILSGIIIIIILILIIYLILNFFKVKDTDIKYTTTTIATNKPIDYGFDELTEEEKIISNERLNQEANLVAINNAFNNDYSLLNINLFEAEINKFKYIYTYLKLNNKVKTININLLNEYNKKLFNTIFYEANIKDYLVEDQYIYDISHTEINYCLKAIKKQNNELFVEMIEKIGDNCDVLIIDHHTPVLHQIKLGFDMVDDNYIYKSFIVVK